MSVTVHHGDSREVLKSIPDASIDSCVCDPPYALVSIGKRFGAENAAPAKPGKSGAYARASAGFMGQKWDTGETAFDPLFWAEVLRVLKPGAHLVAFSGTRTYHRMACAIEDAGFEIRDQIGWLYGSGFPKSHNQSGEWEGWGSALKPAWEPIVLARKPLIGTISANLEAHGAGALNIDGCRVEIRESVPAYRQPGTGKDGTHVYSGGWRGDGRAGDHPDSARHNAAGRWPANVIHDGSEEVVAAFPETGVSAGRDSRGRRHQAFTDDARSSLRDDVHEGFGDSGSAARFFYSGKADKSDRVFREVEEVKVSWISDQGPRQVVLQADTAQSLEKAIVVSGSAESNEWNTFLSGSTITALFLKGSKCTISTKTSSTIASRTWSLLMRSLTNASMADVKSATENGGSHAESAESFSGSLTITLGETASLPGANLAVSATPLTISVSEKRHSHPTTKPVDLMAYLCRLVTRPGGTVLDPFAGSGSTGMACLREGFDCILIEREAQYVADIHRRLAHVEGADTPLFSAVNDEPALFEGAA